MSNTKKTWIVAISIIAVLAVIGAVVWMTQRGDSQQEQLSTPSAPVTSPTQVTLPPNSGAAGQVSSDLLGRRVADYGTGVGKPLTADLYVAEDRCSGAERVRVPGGMEIQRSHQVMTMWTETDGPSTITDGLPTGYSHTPVGAALAGANFNSLLSANSDVMVSVLEHGFAWNADQEDAIAQARSRVADNDGSPRQGGEFTPVTEAFRIISCADDLVVVELALPMTADLQGPTEKYWKVNRLPMVWVNDQWLINGADQNTPVRGSIQELGGDWVRWDL